MTAVTVEVVVGEAVERVESEMRRAAPFLAEGVARWMRGLWRTGRPEDYFLQPDRFPMIHLPWWLEKKIRGAVDAGFQGGLAYSSVNGYYFIRLVDDVMDSNGSAPASLLPALGLFHAEFLSSYHRWFPADHPFWNDFRAIWYGAADAAARDAALEDVDHERFVEVAARKISAAKIPLAAVGHRYGALDRLVAWSDFCDRLGRFEQLTDDLFDWHDDLRRGAATWVLSEAGRRATAGESVAAWIVREGFEWGVDTLRSWMTGLREAARELESPEVVEHLTARESRLLERRDGLRPGLRSLGILAGAMNHR
jgi:hypothetical protein